MIYRDFKRFMSETLKEYTQYGLSILRTTSNTTFGIFAFIIFMGMLFYYSSARESSMTSNANMYIFAIILPLAFILYVKKVHEIDPAASKIFFPTVIVFIIMAALYFYMELNQRVMGIISYVFVFLTMAIIAVALAIILFVFGNYLKTLTGWLGFIAHFVFYIPCLIIDFYNYIIREIKLTTNPVFMLLITEILLILIYIYVPKFLTKLENRDAISLFSGSTFLNAKNVLTTGMDLSTVNPNDLTDQTPIFRKNYSISMWIYLNSMPPNHAAYAKETTIFSYNGTGSGGKPKITYFNNTSDDAINAKDKVIVYFSDDTTKIPGVKIDFAKQKWNQVVFNYTSDNADLFINGVLVHSCLFKNGAPNYTGTETVTAGSDNGLYGAICNIKYHKHTLTKLEIVNSYNLLMNRNPPTNIL